MNDDAWPPPSLPPRKSDSHKGDFGHALLIGGSRGMSGAISLAGMAALRGGAGLVTLAVPDRCLETVASFEPSYMTVPMPDDGHGQMATGAQAKLASLAQQSTALACGPGLGRSDDLTFLARDLYQSIERPLVMDADGLNALAAVPEGLSQPGGPRVITPHPGELRRLLSDPLIAADRLPKCAIQLAASNRIVVVLKGDRTLVTDGDRTIRNQTGNPGMATGGSGDVLTGLVTALLCQKLEPFDAARLAVYLHSLAGDLAAKKLGENSLTASDLVRFLPDAFLHSQQTT